MEAQAGVLGQNHLPVLGLSTDSDSTWGKMQGQADPQRPELVLGCFAGAGRLSSANSPNSLRLVLVSADKILQGWGKAPEKTGHVLNQI